MKRIISMVLTLTMVLGLMPAAMAAPPSPEETVNDLPVGAEAESALTGTVSPDEPDDSMPSEAEKLFGEGAMYLEDFLAEHQGAAVYGLKSGITTFSSTPVFDDKTRVNPNWFKADVALVSGDTIDVDTGYGGNGATTTWKVTNPTGYTVAVEPGEPSSNIWSGPLASSKPGSWWNELGFLPWGANYYPRISGGGVNYGVSAAEVTNKATGADEATGAGKNITMTVYRWGTAVDEDTHYLWISVNPDGSSPVIFEKPEKTEPYVTLHYTPLKYNIKYEIYVNDKKLTKDQCAEIWTPAAWSGVAVDSEDTALNAVFGSNRPTTTTGQVTDLTVEIPKGNYGDVYVYETPAEDKEGPRPASEKVYSKSKNAKDEEYDKEGTWPLGAEVKYIDNSAVAGYPEDGPTYFSLKGDYKIEASSDVTVRVNLRPRTSPDGFVQDNSRLRTVIGNDRGFDETNNDDMYSYTTEYGYTWQFSFKPEGGNTNYQTLSAFEVNGESVPVPSTDKNGKTQQDSELSTGEKVRIEAVTDQDSYGWNLTYEYTVTISNAFRNLTITDASTSQPGNNSVETHSINLDPGTDSQLKVELYYSNDWRTIAPGNGVIVYKAPSDDNADLFTFEEGPSVGGSGRNIRVSMPDGYAWKGSDYTDTITTGVKAETAAGNTTNDATLDQVGGYYYGLLTDPRKNEKNNDVTLKLTPDTIQPIKYKVRYQNVSTDDNYLIVNEKAKTFERSELDGLNPRPSTAPAEAEYHNFNGTGGFSAAGDSPKLTTTGGKYYEFKYWVLTDASGYPMTTAGSRITGGNFGSDWHSLTLNQPQSLSELLDYTRSTLSGWENDTHIIYLTAAWEESEAENFTYHLTFNTKAYPQADRSDLDTNKSNPDRSPGKTFHDQVDRTIPGIDVQQKGDKKYVSVAVSETEVFDFFKNDEDTINDWFVLDEAESSSWSEVYNGETKELWFRDTLGRLTITNKLVGGTWEDSVITYNVKFTLPADNPKTVGDESNFFEEFTEYRGNNNQAVTTDGTRTATVQLVFNGEESASYTFVLPEGTKYDIEMVERDGYTLTANSDRSSTLWPDGKIDVNGAEKKEGGTVVGWTGEGIVAYVNQEITFQVQGEYFIELQQRSSQGVTPNNTDNNPTLANVQPFSYLSYDVTAKNMLKDKKTVYVTIGVKYSQENTHNLSLVNVGYINDDGESITVEEKDEDFTKDNGDPKYEMGEVGPENNRVTWTYDKDNKRVIFGPIDLDHGGSTLRFLVRTSVPAVDNTTVITGTAAIWGSKGHTPLNSIEDIIDDIDDDNNEPLKKSDPPVTATVYPTWLRVFAYAGTNINKDSAAWKTKAVMPITVGIRHADGTKPNAIRYMLFTSSDAHGLEGGTEYLIYDPGQYNPDEEKDKGATPYPTLNTNGDYSTFTVNLSHNQRIVIYDLDGGDDYVVSADKDNPLSIDNEPIPCAIYTNNEDAHKDEPVTGAAVQVTGKIDAQGLPDASPGDNKDDIAIFRFVPVHNLTVAKTMGPDGKTEPKDSEKKQFKVVLDIMGVHEFTQEGQKLYLDVNSTHYHELDSGKYTPMEQGNDTIYRYEVEFDLSEEEEKGFPDIPDGSSYTVVKNENPNCATTYEVYRTETIDDNGSSTGAETKVLGPIAGSSHSNAEDNLSNTGTTGFYRANEKVNFTNHATSSVTVKKTVEQEAGTEPFNFKVDITLPNSFPVSEDHSYTFPYTLTSKNGSVTGDSVDQNGEEPAETTITMKGQKTTIEVKLAPGDDIIIDGLPYDTEVTVTETATPGDDYDAYYKVDGAPEEPTRSNFTTVKADGNNHTIEFINRRRTGDLTISKEIPEYIEGYDVAEKFSVTVTLLGEAGKAINHTYGGVTFVDGVANNVTISRNEDSSGGWYGFVTIPGLPNGMTYTVKENEGESSVNYDVDYRYSPAAPDQESGQKSGVINAGSGNRATIFNKHKPGSLTVTKTVNSPSPTAAPQFTLKLKYGDKDLDLAKMFAMVKDDPDVESTSSVVTIAGGTVTSYSNDGTEATITISDSSGSVRIDGLPDGVTYTVGTKDDTDHTYTTVYTDASGNSSQTLPTGKIAAADATTPEVKITSYSLHTLTVKKNVADREEDKDKETWEFTLKITKLPDSLSAEQLQLDLTPEGGSDMEWTSGDNDTYTFKLKDDGTNGTIEISGLPYGTKYQIAEEDKPGFTPSYTVGEGSEPQEGGIYTSDGLTGDETVTFINSSTTNDVTISNTVSTSGALKTSDEGKKFTFSVTLVLPTGTDTNDYSYSYSYSGNGDADDGVINSENSTSSPDDSGRTTITTNKSSDGKGIITLQHGQSITIEGLPRGTEVTVTEDTVEGFTTKHKSGETGSILGEGTEGYSDTVPVGDGKGTVPNGYTIAFTNTRQTGNLTITNAFDPYIKGYDDDKEFTFTIKLNDTDINGDIDGVNFENGVGTFMIKGPGSKKIEGLPAVGYTVEEAQDDDYTTKSTDENSNNADTNTVTGTIGNSEKTVTFTNTLTNTGSLTITKIVESVGNLSPDTNKEFTFTVTLKNDKGEKMEITHNFSDGGTGTVNFNKGEATFTLTGATNNNSKTITGLPVGLTYTVVETKDDDYTTKSTYGNNTNVDTNTVTDTIKTDENAVTFTNTRKTGGLTIKKVVNGPVAYGDPTTFYITVRLSGTDASSISGEFGAAQGNESFQNGVATLSLVDKDVKVITGLPTGVTYTVEENTSSLTDRYTVSYDHQVGEGETKTPGKNQGTITDGGNDIVTVTNERKTGNLTVTNTVTGLAGETDKEFVFKVTLTGDGASSINGKFGDATFGSDSNGDIVATFNLKHGEQMKIEGLPTGIRYAVEQTTNDPNYETTYNGETGTITNEVLSPAAFTNKRKTGSLTISKTVDSPVAETGEFKFTVTVGNTLNDKSFNHTYDGVVEFTNGVGTVTISGSTAEAGHLNDWTIERKIEGLPAGMAYKVEEAADDKYTMSLAEQTGTIKPEDSDNAAAKAAFTNTRNTDGTLTVSKTVVGNKNASFSFTVTLSGVSFVDRTNVTGVKSGNGPHADDFKFVDNKITFTLNDGESIKISGLPYGVSYEVEETPNAKYETTVAVEGSKAGTINATTPAHTVDFTNTSLHKLTYNLNGGGIGEGDARNENDVVDPEDYKAGTTNVPLGTDPDPNKFRAYFEGWSRTKYPNPVVTQSQLDNLKNSTDPMEKIITLVDFVDADIEVFAVWSLDANSNGMPDYKETTTGSGYVIALDQRPQPDGFQPGGDPNSWGILNWAPVPNDIVQNFSYLAYTATAWNATANNDVELQVSIEAIPKDNTAGVPRSLNVEWICVDGGEWEKVTQANLDEDGFGTKGWLYNKEDHSIIFAAKAVDSGGSITHSVLTSIPAVNGATTYTGNATLTDAAGKQEFDSTTKNKEKRQVTAYAFAEWLRVINYVGSYDMNTDPWKAQAAIDITVYLKPGSEHGGTVPSTLDYLWFASSNELGVSAGTRKSAPLTEVTIDGEKWYRTPIREEGKPAPADIITLGHGQRLIAYNVKAGDEYEVVASTEGKLEIPYAVYSNYSHPDGPMGTDGSVMVKGTVTRAREEMTGSADTQDIAVFRFVPVHDITLTKVVEGGEPADSGFDFTVALSVPVRGSVNSVLEGNTSLTLDMDSTKFNDSEYDLHITTGTTSWTWDGTITLDPTSEAPASVTFDNVPDGTTYSFTESDYSSGYDTWVEVRQTPTINNSGSIKNPAEDPNPVYKATVNKYESDQEKGLYRAHMNVIFTNSVPHTLTYDLNGGSVPDGTKLIYEKYYQGNTVTLALENEVKPTRSKAVFMGWSRTQPNPEVVTTKAQVDSAVVTSITFGKQDETVYAVWAADENGNGVPDYNDPKPSNPGTTPGGGNNGGSGGGYSDSSDDSGSTYPPSIPQTSHGSVSTSPRNPEQGDVVTITPVPDPGYEVGSVTVKDSRNRTLDVKDNGNGTYSFTQPGNRVTINVTFVPATGASSPAFTDVSRSDYFYEAVRWAVANGVTYGVDNTHFGPYLGCTRAQFVTFLWRAAGSPRPAGAASRFSDVSRTAHAGYYDAILWAVEQGVAAGTGDGSTFSPDAVVTRAQSVTFMSRYANKAGIATKPGVSSFDDVSNAGAMAPYYEAIGWAVANGITAGNSTTANTFGPMDDCNRGMMITFLYRLFTSADA